MIIQKQTKRALKNMLKTGRHLTPRINYLKDAIASSKEFRDRLVYITVCPPWRISPKSRKTN